MRIAFFTSLAPIRSAISDIGEGLAIGMASLGHTVDLVIDDNYTPDNPVIVEQFEIYDYHQFESRADTYDAIFYSMADHAGYHGYMLDFVHRYPGYLMLNDLTLHRCIMAATLGKGDAQAYFKELDYAYGFADMRVVDQLNTSLANFVILDYPLFDRLVDSSKGVIVHNHHAGSHVLDKCPTAKVRRVPMPYSLPPGFPDIPLEQLRTQERARLDVVDDLVFGSFGIFVPDKHLETCLRAFAHVAQSHPQVKYILGGPAVPEYDLAGHIRDMGLEGQVILTGWLNPSEFVHTMAALDVGIHLRYPHIGGTPYTPVRLMGLDICTIVSDIEPLEEFPQGACIKVMPDEYQEDTLTTMLEYLADHPDFRKQIAHNGQEFMNRYHTAEVVAQQCIEFMQEIG